jgi:hypothetical protein
MFPADLAFEFAAAIYDITVEGEGQIMVRMAKVTITPGEPVHRFAGQET